MELSLDGVNSSKQLGRKEAGLVLSLNIRQKDFSGLIYLRMTQQRHFEKFIILH